jgi:hypothetical protein
MRFAVVLIIVASLLAAAARADDPPDLHIPNLPKTSDFDLWFAPAPRLEIDDTDQGKPSPELAAMLHPRAGGGWIIDGETDETFTSCRSGVSARAGFGVFGTALGATSPWRAAMAAGHTVGQVAEAAKAYRGCVEDFYGRVQQAASLIKGLGRTDKAKIEIPRVGGYAKNVNKLIETVGADQARMLLRLNQIDLELKSQQADQAKLTDDVVQLLLQIQRDQDAEAARRRKEELRLAIAAAAQGIELLANIIFASNPELREKIVVSAKAVATVVDSASVLSSDEAKGAEQAIAAMNVYGAIFQMVVMLTSKEQEDPVAHNFKIVIDGLRALHDQIDRRFDRLEGLLLAVTKQLNARFDRVEERIQDLRDRIVTLQEQATIDSRVAQSYLAYLSSRDFKAKQRECLQGLGSLELSLSGYGGCLAAFMDYAIEFAKIDAATGRAFYSPTLSDKSLADRLASPTGLFDVGLLFAALENAAARTNADVSLARLSPSIWVDGAQAYNNLLLRAIADANRLGRTPGQIIDAEAPNVREILDAGRQMDETVNVVSQNALPLAMKLYEQGGEELIKAFVGLYVQDMLDKDLGVFERREERNVELRNEEDSGGYDGRHWFRVRVYSKLNWVGKVAPFKDQRLFAEQVRYNTSVKIHMPQFGDQAELNFYGRPEYMWQLKAAEMPGVVPVSAEEIRKKLQEVNQKYLDAVGVKDFTPEAAAQSNQSMQTPLQNPLLANAFAKLTLAKTIAKKAVTVMWQPDEQSLVDLYVAVDALPDTFGVLFQALEKELAKPIRTECRSLWKCFDFSRVDGPPFDPKAADSTPVATTYLDESLHAALTGQKEFGTVRAFKFGGRPSWTLSVDQQIKALKATCGAGECVRQ